MGAPPATGARQMCVARRPDFQSASDRVYRTFCPSGDSWGSASRGIFNRSTSPIGRGAWAAAEAAHATERATAETKAFMETPVRCDITLMKRLLLAILILIPAA